MMRTIADYLVVTVFILVACVSVTYVTTGVNMLTLSAGQRRRLAMGRLVGSPRALWLLDEPMAPLDARWREAFAGLTFARNGFEHVVELACRIARRGHRRPRFRR